MVQIDFRGTFINYRPVEKATQSQAGLRKVSMLPVPKQILLADNPEESCTTNWWMGRKL